MDRTLNFICFGGPRDGDVVQAPTPPDGYAEYAGCLVVWYALRIDLVPFWQGHTLRSAIQEWEEW